MAATTISRTEQIRAGAAYKWITNNATGILQETTVTGLRAVASDANGLPVASVTTATQLGYLQGLTVLTPGDIIFVNGGGNLADAGIASANIFLADGSVPATANLNAGAFRITNVADPTANQDAATKAYVDSIAAGLSPKGASRAATTAALPAVTYNNGASGVGATLTANANGALASQDGVSLIVGDRLLVKNQVAALQNGIYNVTNLGSAGTPFILTRTSDFDSSTGAGVVEGGSFTFVTSGTTQGSTGWSVVWIGIVDVGTDPINFTQTAAAITYTAGNGIKLSGNIFSITTDSSLVASTSDPTLIVQNSPTGAIVTAVDGLAIQLESVNPSLQINGSDQLGAKLNNAGAIITGASGLSVSVDGSTIDIAANAIRVAPGGITNTQINAAAAIAFSKLAPLTSAHILLGNGSNVATDTAMTGDVTITNTGVTSIAGGVAAHFVTREVPTGAIDGSNTTFTLAFTPILGSEQVYLNGLQNQSGAGNDYTISGAVITYLSAPQPGDRILVSYQK